eukprot:gene18730-13493_t
MSPSRLPTMETSLRIATVAGGSFGSTIDPMGRATSSQFYQPNVIHVDSFSNLYVVDVAMGYIFKVTSDGQISPVINNATGVTCCDNVPASMSRPNRRITGLTSDRWGNLYFTERLAHRIRTVLASNNTVWTVAGVNPGEVAGITDDGYSLHNNFIDGPQNLFMDTSSDRLYYYEFGWCLLRYFSPLTNGPVYSVAGTGGCDTYFALYQFDFTGISAKTIALGGLQALPLYVDSAGGIYFGSISAAAAVYRVFNDTIVRIAGTGTSGTGTSNVQATSTSIRATTGIVGDTAGNIYVSYAGGLRVVFPDGQSTLMSSGSSSIDCVPLQQAGNPGGGGIAIDTAGNLYVSEPSRFRVRVIGDSQYCAPSAAP